MSILFISDIHLCTQQPLITAGFLRFLRVHAIKANALYILGDLFEIWIGDDDPNPLHNKIAIALRKLIQNGVPCYFVPGNRDFLLGKRYAAKSGMKLLPSQLVIQIEGLRVVILHGDTLCINDTKYQYFYRLIHQRWLQWFFLSLPLQIRFFIAYRIRANSILANANKGKDITDVSTQMVIDLMNCTNSTIMIHGHTHRPAIHQLSEERYRVVLGSWHHTGSVIEISTRNVILHEFAFDD